MGPNNSHPTPAESCRKRCSLTPSTQEPCIKKTVPRYFLGHLQNIKSHPSTIFIEVDETLALEDKWKGGARWIGITFFLLGDPTAEKHLSHTIDRFTWRQVIVATAPLAVQIPFLLQASVRSESSQRNLGNKDGCKNKNDKPSVCNMCGWYVVKWSMDVYVAKMMPHKPNGHTLSSPETPAAGVHPSWASETMTQVSDSYPIVKNGASHTVPHVSDI